ncbi:hypothetical protein M9434_007141 [Picochlorum sp. BPE23]|nr:hypothetical protein M9434_007141 [Picochlorum sp. BPE23]
MEDSAGLDFMPGVVCGGSMTKRVMKKRSKVCTEDHVRKLKESEAFKAWERGEDLQAFYARHDGKLTFERIGSFLRGMTDTMGDIGSALKNITTRRGFRASVIAVALVVVVVLGGGWLYAHRGSLHASLPVDEQWTRPVDIAETIRSELVDVVPSKEVEHEENRQEVVEEENVSLLSAELSALQEKYDRDVSELKQALKDVRDRVSRRVDDLELEVQVERKRASQAKAKEDSMFSALEASTQKVHTMSKQLKEYEGQISMLESNVRLSIEHSSVIKSVDLTLMTCEGILLLGAFIAYLKAQRLRTSMYRATRSYMMAYRRQQSILAAAEDVYAGALEYKSEVEASDVAPREAPMVLKPWDPIIGELETLIKSSLTVDRNATPVQTMAALRQHFSQHDGRKLDSYRQKIEELQMKLNEYASATESREQTVVSQSQQLKDLQSRLESAEGRAHDASSASAVLQEKISSLEEEVRNTEEEKKAVSERLARTEEELDKVMTYAQSMGDSGIASPLTRVQDHDVSSSVRDHLNNFQKSMDHRSAAVNVDDDDVKENLGDSALGERLKRIRQLIQEANESPFELLSPSNVNSMNDSMDAETALKNVPVIGAMHISSSDEEDETRYEGSGRMLDASEMLSNEVAEYTSILERFENSPKITQKLRKLTQEKNDVDRLRRQLEELVKSSQKEAKAYGALKSLRQEVDFLSDKEEMEHGLRELQASDALFFARKKERDACSALETRQSTLRQTLMDARDMISSQITS